MEFTKFFTAKWQTNVNKNGKFKVSLRGVSGDNLVKISYFDRPQIIKGVSEIAEQKIDVLAELWKKLFEPEIGQEHMKMLLEHVDAFFTDIIFETQNREKAIRERIESKHN